MKQYRKTTGIVAGILVAALLLSTTAFAVETRASSRINKVYANLYADKSGNLSISFSVTARGLMDVIGASEILIQRFDGSKWISEETLTVVDVPELQTKDASRYSKTISYAPAYTGVFYRIIVTAYAKDKSGASTSQATSTQVKT